MNQKKIVVIDDCPFHLQLVKGFLEPAGYRVETAESTIDANPMIYTTPLPDLILVDVEMPMLDGPEKVRLLKKMEGSRNIPTLLMSAKPPEAMAELAEQAGAEGFICKPFDCDGLLSMVASHI